MGCDIRNGNCMEDVQFEKIDGKRCAYVYETFSDITSAEERCRRDSRCKGIYDNGCDESTNDVNLCMVGHDYEGSSTSCIYDKNEITSGLDQKSHELLANEL